MSTSHSFTLCANEPIFDQKPNRYTTEINPKREMQKIPNPYLLFCKERRTALHKTNPEMPSRDVTKILANEWKNMSENEKNKYKVKYQNRIKSKIQGNSPQENCNIAQTNYLNFTLPNGQVVFVPVTIYKPGVQIGSD